MPRNLARLAAMGPRVRNFGRAAAGRARAAVRNALTNGARQNTASKSPPRS